MSWSSRGRRRERVGARTAFAGSLVVHGLILAVVWWSAPGTRMASPPVYRVNLVAAPRPEPEERPAPDVVERPAERTVPTAEPPRRTSVARMPPPPDRAPAEREPAPRTTPPETPAPDERPSTGKDVATVRTTGVEFPYPEYLRNLVAQIYRRWRRPTGSQALRAEVLFFVHRDGSVTNLQFVARSGSFAFDLEAQGAVEAAGTAGAFGPLPADYPADVLPVRFFFHPERAP